MSATVVCLMLLMGTTVCYAQPIFARHCMTSTSHIGMPNYRGWIELFLLLDTCFPPEKGFLGHNTKYWPDRNCKCGSFTFWRWGHLHPASPMAYMIVWRHTGISTVAFVQIFLFLLGRSGQSGFAQKADPANKKCTHELFIIHWAGVVAFFTNGIVAIVNVASLPSSWWGYCCRWCSGISAVVKLALLPLSLVVKLVLLALLWWSCCHQCAGVFAVFTLVIFALVTMALLPSSMCRHLHRCWGSIVACRAGVVTLVMMASMPSMRRHLCCCRDCDCCPHNNGFDAIVDAQATLLLSSWHCCPHNNGVVALYPHRHCCPCCTGIVAVLKLALLPLLQWHCCHHQCTGILAIIAMTLLPSLQWRCCRGCAASLLLLQWQLLPLLWLHLCRSWSSVVIKLALLPL